MKKAKVSAVYEGRRRRRGRGGRCQEAESDSRMARLNARARKYVYIPKIRGSNNSSFTYPQKTIMTRSMLRSIQFMESKNFFVDHVHHHQHQPVGFDVVEENKRQTNHNHAAAGAGAGVVVDQPKMEVMTTDLVPSEPKADPSSGAINNILVEPQTVAKKPIFDASFARVDDQQGGGPDWWEEWPFRLSYEEELMWTKTDTRPKWEVMNGDIGAPLGVHDVDDLWNFGDINGRPQV